ncbi:hypothetical protein BC833DRAFT_603095 [Globomyces pollinis-pini]|nr:hypothetical protein BC833DRAFT_603095 [Globomyces pollinis-pini]KAJ2989378.1 hypothetical protein HDV02_005041 [Globomyces sp. JEL0801]
MKLNKITTNVQSAVNGVNYSIEFAAEDNKNQGLNQMNIIQSIDSKTTVPLKECLGKFISSGGWAVIKEDVISRKVIKSSPLTRKITWINPLTFHFTWNDATDYRLWTYDISNRAYYQIGHDLKLCQVLSAIENNGWNFFKKVHTTLEETLAELKLSEYKDVLSEQGFTLEKIIHLPNHYDALGIKLAHRHDFDDLIAFLKESE